MTNETFFINLSKANHGEIIDIEHCNGNSFKPILIDKNGVKTYKFYSYGSQEWLNIYYISFDASGNFVDISYAEDESFC